MTSPSTRVCTVVALFAVSTGCESSPPPEVSAYRESLLVATEPKGAITIEQARKELTDKNEIVLIGRVGSRDVSEWSMGTTGRFVISEAFPDSHYNLTPDHDPATCPFCRHKWKVEDSVAFVDCIDESGSPISLPAGELLPLEKGDTVVIRGAGALDDSGFLCVRTRELFVRAGL